MRARPAATFLPVSVVIAAYNQSAMLRRALESVAAHRPSLPAEVVVVDDASEDDTSETAARLGARVVRHERNRGTAAARNSGVSATTQPWIALLDHDDEWLPGHLSLLWEQAGSNALVAASALRCARNPLEDRLQGAPGETPVHLTPEQLIFPGNLIPASAAMVRRDVLESCGGFRPPDGVDDLDLWIRVLERGTGVLLPKVTVIYHEHQAQASLKVRAMQASHIKVAERYADRPWWSSAHIDRWRALAAWNNVRSALRHRQPIEAVKHAAWIASRARRVAAAIRGSSLRARLRRKAARIARDGGPTVVVLSRTAGVRDRAAHVLNGRPALYRAPGDGRAAAYLRLVRRPAASALAASRTEAILLRAAGVREISPLPPLVSADSLPTWPQPSESGADPE